MDNKIRDNLEKQFGKLSDQETAPDRLKEEVFQTLDTANMIGDIAGLFTSTFVQTGAKLIGVIHNEKQVDHQFDKSSNDDDEINSDIDADIEDPDDQSYAIEEPEN